MFCKCIEPVCEHVDIKLHNKMYSGLCVMPSYRPIGFPFMQQNCKEPAVEIEFCFRSLFMYAASLKFVMGCDRPRRYTTKTNFVIFAYC